MLVLTRRIDEQIVLPDQAVTVTVLSVSGSRVKLGVSAPPDTRILRQELFLRQRNSHNGETVASDSRDLAAPPGLAPQGARERCT